MNGERGIVLVIAMLLITVLSLVGAAANRSVVTDTAITSNYLSSLQSFYAAEAGLERGKLECVKRFMGGNWNDFTSLLDGTDPLMSGSPSSLSGLVLTKAGGVVSSASLTFHDRFYTVTISNDPGDAGGVNKDTNRAITISSTGTSGSSTTTVSTMMIIHRLPKIPGSISLVDDANVSFGGAAFMINGNDHLLDNAPGPNPPRYGITLCNTIQTTSFVASALSKNQKENVQGLGYVPATSADAVPSIGTSSELTGAILESFVDVIKRVADYTTVAGNNIFGTAENPKITYISNQNVSFSGNTSGYGILVVDGGDLDVSGSIDWKGIIVVLGGKFRRTGGGGVNNVTGALVVGGGPDAGLELDLSGSLNLLYSQQAIDMVTTHINSKLGGNSTALSWRRVHRN